MAGGDDAPLEKPCVIEDAELRVRRLCPFRRDGTFGPGQWAPVEDEGIEQRQPEAHAHEGEQEQQSLKPVAAGGTHGGKLPTRPAGREVPASHRSRHLLTPLDARPVGRQLVSSDRKPMPPSVCA